VHKELGFAASMAAAWAAAELASARHAGTAIHDALLGSLALLPLRHLSLTDTGVTEEGVGQLLAMTSLTHLGLRNSQAGDGAYAVLAQLPLLRSLDLSGTEFAGVSLLSWSRWRRGACVAGASRCGL
jgi:hypothetical protein